MRFIKHEVREMDDTMMQVCVLCGELISDYTNVAWPANQPAPKGWNAGPIYVSPGQPMIFTTVVDQNDEVVECTQVRTPKSA